MRFDGEVTDGVDGEEASLPERSTRECSRYVVVPLTVTDGVELGYLERNMYLIQEGLSEAISTAVDDCAENVLRAIGQRLLELDLADSETSEGGKTSRPSDALHRLRPSRKVSMMLSHVATGRAQALLPKALQEFTPLDKESRVEEFAPGLSACEQVVKQNPGDPSALDELRTEIEKMHNAMHEVVRCRVEEVNAIPVWEGVVKASVNNFGGICAHCPIRTKAAACASTDGQGIDL